MSKETLFYDVIKNMFIGTKTDCQDRFTNLMKIKEKYYEMLEDTLKNNIDEVLKKYPSFRDELFDMLYSFFSRYVTENGSIYYTDTKDVTLFWKTQMYYYVKTNKLCKSIPTQSKRSEVDFFINKNTKVFLQEQFKLWLSQYLWNDNDELTPDRINQLQILKDITFKIIDFMSKFEDELVKIWNKPKFVKNSNYVITLDRLTKLGDKGMDVIQKLVSHQNMDKQIEEWKELGIIDNDFNKEDIFESNLLEKRLSDKYKFLPVDTKYFKDLEPEILSLFDDLDNSLDGWLIKSENYQALNTILPKFKDKVKTVYIDPPYNTGNNRFVYNDKYQHSSWLTMMENRLSLTKELMRDDGVIFVSIDDHEVTQLKMLMNVIFGEENFVGDLIRKTKSMTGDKKTGLNIQHESIVCYARNISNMFLKGEEKDFNEYDNPDNDPNGEWISADPSAKSGGPSLYFEIINPYTGKIDLPPKGRYWAFSKETFIEYVKKGKIKFKTQHKDNERGFIFKRYKNELQSSRNPVNSLEFCDNIYMNQVGTKELRELLNGEYFQNPKPVVLIKKLIYYSTSKTDIILDFFGGSGTTVHAVMKLNSEDNGKRKFILIEMGDYFNTVIIPRIKKVSYSFNWKNGRPQDTSGIGVFFKYYELEQFEDVLSNTMYINDETVLKSLETGYDDGKVKVKLNMLYPDVDVVETLSNLTGKWIKKIKGDVVEFEDGSKVNIKELDYKLIKPLIW